MDRLAGWCTGGRIKEMGSEWKQEGKYWFVPVILLWAIAAIFTTLIVLGVTGKLT